MKIKNKNGSLVFDSKFRGILCCAILLVTAIIYLSLLFDYTKGTSESVLYLIIGSLALFFIFYFAMFGNDISLVTSVIIDKDGIRELFLFVFVRKKICWSELEEYGFEFVFPYRAGVYRRAEFVKKGNNKRKNIYSPFYPYYPEEKRREYEKLIDEFVETYRGEKRL